MRVGASRSEVYSNDASPHPWRCDATLAARPLTTDVQSMWCCVHFGSCCACLLAPVHSLQMTVMSDEKKLAVQHAVLHENDPKASDKAHGAGHRPMSPHRAVLKLRQQRGFEPPILGAVSRHGSCVSEVAKIYGKAINQEVSAVVRACDVEWTLGRCTSLTWLP